MLEPKQLEPKATEYVKAYQDLSLKSLFVVVGLFGPCTWEPDRGVPGCRGGLRPLVVFLFRFGS